MGKSTSMSVSPTISTFPTENLLSGMKVLLPVMAHPLLRPPHGERAGDMDQHHSPTTDGWRWSFGVMTSGGSPPQEAGGLDAPPVGRPLGGGGEGGCMM